MKELPERVKNEFLKPKKAKALWGKDAWYYRNSKDIEIYISSDTATLAAKITRAQLKRWLELTE